MSALATTGSFCATAFEAGLSWLLRRPDPVSAQPLANPAIGAAYLAIAAVLTGLLSRPRQARRIRQPDLLARSAVLCGLGYLAVLAVLCYPDYGPRVILQAAAVSLGTLVLARVLQRRGARPAPWQEAAVRGERAKPEAQAVEHARELASLHARLAREVAERQRVERDLRRTEALLGRYVENTPLGVIEFELVDPAGPRWEVRRWSGQAERIFGWTEAEAQGRTTDELGLIVPEDLEQARAHARVLASGGEVRTRQLWRNRRIGDDELRYCTWYSSTVPPDGDGPRGALAVVEDITPRLRALEEVKRLARHDPLTGVANRLLFRERFDQALAAARRSRGRAALLIIDLDHFKPVNDRLGHAAGDELLRAAARRMAGEVRAHDTFARLGGDEFAVVQAGVLEPADVTTLAERLVATLRAPFAIDGQAVLVGASVGAALFPDDADDAEALLRRADRALYRAKAEARGRHDRHSREAIEPDRAGSAAGIRPAA